MKLYADHGTRATSQLLGDALVAGWVLLWIWAARQLHELISALAVPGAKAEAAGRSLQSGLRNAAKNVGDIPLAGDQLRRPLDEGASSGAQLAEAARSYQDSVARLALVAAVLVALAPIVIVLALWLPRRLGWINEASAATRLLRADPGALHLLALRALAGRSLHELARTGRDTAGLVEAWRSGDRAVVERLARLELDTLGVRIPAQVAADGPTG